MSLFLFGTLLAVGLFFVLADALHLPTLATEKAMGRAASKPKKVSSLDMWLSNLSVALSKIISINEYKRVKMQNTLNAAGIGVSPEMYTANCILKSAIIAVGILPSLVFLPIAAPVLLALAIITYFSEVGKADKLLKDKREKIENDLPRFTATITQELKNSRDVLRILDNFKHSASEDFSKELDMLTADMRSGGYESALTRFEARLNSPMLSDIVRGLISVLRGDDGTVYFQMLTHDMKQLELQKLKMRAMKIPLKIRKFSFAMLTCFLLTYMVVLGYEIVRAMGTMF